MYGISLYGGGFIRSGEMQQALANICHEAGGETGDRAFFHLGQIEKIEARGISYANQDFDVLSSALNFLDAVAPATANHLRTEAHQWHTQRASRRG